MHLPWRVIFALSSWLIITNLPMSYGKDAQGYRVSTIGEQLTVAEFQRYQNTGVLPPRFVYSTDQHAWVLQNNAKGNINPTDNSLNEKGKVLIPRWQYYLKNIFSLMPSIGNLMPGGRKDETEDESNGPEEENDETEDENNGTDDEKNGTEDENGGTEDEKNGTEDEKNGKEDEKNGTEVEKNGTEDGKNGTEDGKNGTEDGKNGTEDKNAGTENKNDGKEGKKDDDWMTKIKNSMPDLSKFSSNIPGLGNLGGSEKDSDGGKQNADDNKDGGTDDKGADDWKTKLKNSMPDTSKISDYMSSLGNLGGSGKDSDGGTKNTDDKDSETDKGKTDYGEMMSNHLETAKDAIESDVGQAVVKIGLSMIPGGSAALAAYQTGSKMAGVTSFGKKLPKIGG